MLGSAGPLRHNGGRGGIGPVVRRSRLSLGTPCKAASGVPGCGFSANFAPRGSRKFASGFGRWHHAWRWEGLTRWDLRAGGRSSGMYARVSTIEGAPDKVDDVARQTQEQTLPQLQKMEGFKGFVALGDRQSGKMLGVSFWESEEALRGSEEAASSVRRGAAGAADGIVASVEEYEVLVNEAPSAGPLGAVTGTVGGVTDTVGGATQPGSGAQETVSGVADTLGGTTGDLLGGGEKKG